MTTGILENQRDFFEFHNVFRGAIIYCVLCKLSASSHLLFFPHL